MKNRKNQGQVLIEALIALAVVTFVIAGIVIALITSVNNSTFTRNQNLATNYAQEGLDIARNIKESDYSYFAQYQGYYCLPEGVTDLDSAPFVDGVCEKISDTFTRQIFIDETGADSKKDPPVQKCGVTGQTPGTSIYVVSIVSWNDSRCDSELDQCHSIEIDSCFSDFNRVAPL